MKPQRPPNEDRQGDLFKRELLDVIDTKHPLVHVSHGINWREFDDKFEVLFCSTNGRPAVPTRLMVGLHYLKYCYDLSDEEVLAGWLENPYWQYFCGGKYFEHRLPLDSSSMTRWRKRIGEDGALELLEETIQTSLRLGYVKSKSLEKINVDTTVQTKAIRYPTDARLYDRARQKLVKCAQEEGIELRQNYRFIGQRTLLRQSHYARAGQFKKAAKETKKLKTLLGRVHRDVSRKVKEGNQKLHDLMNVTKRLLEQKRADKNKIYSIHEPEVECIAKGKINKKYEFGNKVSVVTTATSNWVVGMLSLKKNAYDGHTLIAALQQVEKIIGNTPKQAVCDLGYRKHGYEGLCKVQIVKRNSKNLKRSERYWWKRRNAIEPLIGHLKAKNRLERNRLKGLAGNGINAVLAGSGINLRKILRILCWPNFLERFFVCLSFKNLLFWVRYALCAAF